ncbi:Ig-like domain-containing protein [Mycetocola lacteus]|nr:Ig-like domain-containing protein [Mycetocola lacteus]
MTSQHVHRTPILRALTLLIAVCALVAGYLVAGPTAPARAMTQVGTASGYPGDTVQVQVQNTIAGAPNTGWTINAPVGTSIVSAVGSSASGSTSFGCTPTASGVSCGPSSAGGWAAGNIVTLQVRINDNRAAGTALGVSFIPGDEGVYRITVLAPPAPIIQTPAPGTRSLETQPTITGTKRAGNAAAITIDGAPACTIPASSATTWTCLAPAPLTPGTHTFSATQTSPAGDVSPASDASTYEVLEPAALTLTQGGPETAVPTVALTRTLSITNGGPGAATDTSVTLSLGGFPATACRVGTTAVDCATLTAGRALGTLATGQNVELSIDGTVPADTAAGTTYPLSATLASINDAASPITSAATLTVAAPEPPRILAPEPGGSTTLTAPEISGNAALPGARVEVSGPNGIVCTATASATGTWACTPATSFALGGVKLSITQSLGGLTSAPMESTFTVIETPRVPPPLTPPPTTAPGPPAPRPTPGTGASPRPQPTPPPTLPPTAPMVPPEESPAPTPEPGSPAQARISALPMDLSFAASRIDPGTVGVMRGTLGPNRVDEAVTVRFSGRTDSGMIYRAVTLRDDGRCAVLTLTFSCTITLEPGQSAAVEIYLYADALNAPDIARQQFTTTTNLTAQANSQTSTIPVGLQNESAALASTFSTFPIATFPGALIPLLALLLLALAATETEKRRRRPRPSDSKPTATNPPRSES